MEIAIDCGRPGNDLTPNPQYGRTQNRNHPKHERVIDLTKKPIFRYL
jgi:hypothetical protein